MSPPWEKQLGQPLFHRQRGAKPRLTQAGQTLYAYAVDLLRKSGETEAALTRMRGKNQAEIAIAAQRDIAQYYLPPLLTEFAAAHPGTRFVTHTGTLENVMAQVRERAVDVRLSRGDGAGAADADAAATPRAVFCLSVSPRHPAGAQGCGEALWIWPSIRS